MYLMTSVTWEDAEVNAEDGRAKEWFDWMLNPTVTIFKHRKDAIRQVDEVKAEFLKNLREWEEKPNAQLEWAEEEGEGDTIVFIAKQEAKEFGRIKITEIETY